MAAAANNQSFQIILNTEVDLVLETILKFVTRNNTNTATLLLVDELQFRITD
jgi:hypothetical protein